MNSFALRITGCLVLYPNVLLLVLPPTRNVLSLRNGENWRSLSFAGRDFLCFRRLTDVPKDFCCDACSRWFPDFSLSVQLRALFFFILSMPRKGKTCAVALSSLVHFKNLSTSMTAFTGCCIVVTFVLSALSILFQLFFGSIKNEGRVSQGFGSSSGSIPRDTWLAGLYLPLMWCQLSDEELFWISRTLLAT